jgi:hypothetical protein
MRKLLLKSLIDLDFKLIGISASEEPFKMAFLMNTFLKTHFKRAKNDVELITKKINVSFSLYTYEDPKTTRKLYFVQNKSQYIDQNPKFANSLSKNQEQILGAYLLKSHKQSDYLIKIEDEFDRFKIKKMIHDLNEIPQIISAYEINREEIKSPGHLIFE